MWTRVITKSILYKNSLTSSLQSSHASSNLSINCTKCTARTT